MLSITNHAQRVQIAAMTFNIRYDSPNDGENMWIHRKGMVASVIEKSDCDFVGLQEAMMHQCTMLNDTLKDYEITFRTREIDPTKGESCAILYKSDRWQLLDDTTFWFSDTPDVPASMTWGNRYPRIVTRGVFMEKKTGKIIYVYNVHLDHESQVAREKSCAMLVDFVEKDCKVKQFVILGDFNAEEGNPAIKLMNQPFLDAYRSVNQVSPIDETFHDWDMQSHVRIDYIFLPKKTKVKSAKVIAYSENSHYPSDHYPVMCEFILK